MGASRVVMGRVGAPFGVRGWVRVEPWSEDPAALLAHAAWWLRGPGGGAQWREVAVCNARMHGTGLLAEIRGVTSREAAATLRGCEVGLPREALAAPAANEYYWADLEGLAVVNRAGTTLGHVAGLVASGAHAILRVASPGETERLIPFVAAYVDRIDLPARRIEVDWQADY